MRGLVAGDPGAIEAYRRFLRTAPVQPVSMDYSTGRVPLTPPSRAPARPTFTPRVVHGESDIPRPEPGSYMVLVHGFETDQVAVATLVTSVVGVLWPSSRDYASGTRAPGAVV